MNDAEMRALLEDVISDLDAGRVALPRPRRRLLRYLGPPLLAASLGMVGCSQDALEPPQDGATQTDATVDPDGGFVPEYMAPFDAGPDLLYMAPFDGSVAIDGGAVPEYMAVFDASTEIDEDAGAMPLYMGPPPPSP